MSQTTLYKKCKVINLRAFTWHERFACPILMAPSCELQGSYSRHQSGSCPWWVQVQSAGERWSHHLGGLTCRLRSCDKSDRWSLISEHRIWNSLEHTVECSSVKQRAAAKTTWGWSTIATRQNRMYWKASQELGNDLDSVLVRTNSAILSFPSMAPKSCWFVERNRDSFLQKFHMFRQRFQASRAFKPMVVMVLPLHECILC